MINYNWIISLRRIAHEANCPSTIPVPQFHKIASIHFETYRIYSILSALSCEHIFIKKKSEPGISRAFTSQICGSENVKIASEHSRFSIAKYKIYLVFILKVCETCERQCMDPKQSIIDLNFKDFQHPNGFCFDVEAL